MRPGLASRAAEMLSGACCRAGPRLGSLMLAPVTKTVPAATQSLRFRSTSSVQGFSEQARERSKSVTSFYNQSAIDVSAEKVRVRVNVFFALVTPGLCSCSGGCEGMKRRSRHVYSNVSR